jgi:hypothetical protein
MKAIEVGDAVDTTETVASEPGPVAVPINAVAFAAAGVLRAAAVAVAAAPTTMLAICCETVVVYEEPFQL